MDQNLKKYQLITDFLHRLEEDGYPLGVGIQLKVQKLLSLLPEDIPLEKLGNYLIPLLARNKEEQYRFQNHFQNALKFCSEINTNDFEIDEEINEENIGNGLKRFWWIFPILLIPLSYLLYLLSPQKEIIVKPVNYSHIERFEVEANDGKLICLDTIPNFQWIVEASKTETARDSIWDDFGIYSIDTENICLEYEAKNTIGTADTIFFNWINSENQNILVKYVPEIIPEIDSVNDVEEVESPPLPQPPPIYEKQKLPYYESHQRLLPQVLTSNEQLFIDNFWWLRLLFILLSWYTLMTLIEVVFFRKAKEKDSSVVADRENSNLPPYVWNIELEGNGNISLEEDIILTIRQLKERAKNEGSELDINKTIFSTIDKGGRFSPDFKQFSRPPEYLLLIEKRDFADHRAMLSNTLYQTFKENEILVERYFYEAADLRRCFNEEFRDGIKIPDLIKKHGDSRLVIMGTATALLNPYSGKLEKWTRIFEAWKERVIMTPKTIDVWTRQENRLEEMFTVIPNHHSILGDWTNTLKNDLDWDKSKWENILPIAQTEAIQLREDLIATLNKHYDKSTQLWIAACAVYPSIHWDLTIHLGHFLEKELGDEELVSFNNLSSICRLQWFVNGEIPSTVRADLMGFLQKEHPALLKKIRQNINEVLENNQPPVYSVAYEEYRMNMAINQLILEDDPKKKKELENEIIKNLNEGIEGDFSMLRKISKKQLNALAFQVSDQLAKYIKEDEEILEEKDTSTDEKEEKKRPFYKIVLALFFLLNLMMIYNLNRAYQTINNDCKACNETTNPTNDFNLREFFLPTCTDVNRIAVEYDSQKICLVNNIDSLLHFSHKGMHQIYSQANADTASLDYLVDLERLNDPNVEIDYRDTAIDNSRKVYENIAVAYYNKAVGVYDSLKYDKMLKAHDGQIPFEEVTQPLTRGEIQQASICDLIQKAYDYDSMNIEVIRLMQDCGNTIAPVNIVKGKILNAKTKEPLPNVKIFFNGRGETITDSKGEYELASNSIYIIEGLSKAWFDSGELTSNYIDLLTVSNLMEIGTKEMSPISYKAKILDKKENPIPNVKLINEKYKINLETDGNGFFTLEGKSDFPDADIQLNTSTTGYKNSVITIYKDLDKNPENKIYQLEVEDGNSTEQNTVIDEANEEAFPVEGSNDLIIVKKNGLYGIKKGDNLLVAQSYTEINSYQTEKEEVYFILKKSSNYLFYQENILKPIGNFSFIGEMTNDFARIQRGNKWGFINYKGELINPIYDEVSDFKNDFATVIENGRTIKINTIGECVENCTNENSEYQQNLDLGDTYFDKGDMRQAKVSYLNAQEINDTEEVRGRIEKSENNLIITALEKNMKTIPGGTFIMGCKEGRDEKCADDEKPEHNVTVSSFKMSKYEVTQEEWRAVMGRNPEGLRFKGCDKCPVENVSEDDVQGFLKKLNKITGKKYRLPTEAEWEYAARGGEDYQYAGSDNLDEIAWYNDNSGSKTHPVGQKKANGFGLYDMSGNVWEWCEDGWHDYYKGAPEDGSAWVDDDKGNNYGMVRGGSWYNNELNCRVSYRSGNLRSNRNYIIGFRLVWY